MAATHRDHPTRSQLHEYALGKGGIALRAYVENHLATCSVCAALLVEVPEDTLVGKLRDTGTLGPTGDTLNAVPDIPAELIDHPRYLIVRQLGMGGMGVVYQAVHRLMERDVALKVISSALMRHPVAVQRFIQEVKAAARLNHPNIVAAHDAEQVGDLHFLVMEYVDGASLDRLVRKNGPMAVTVACYMVRQALVGLQHAHEQGLVHRDLKPQNLMVTRRGQVKVLDFGLARLAEEANRTDGARPLTTVGTVVGTPDYIAPEQVSNSHTVDIRADVYSLGCTLYFLLTGRPPFPEGSALEKALAHVQQQPPSLLSLRAEVPGDLVAIVERMMAKKPDARFATPGEAAQELLPFTRSGGSTSVPAPPPSSPTVVPPPPPLPPPSPRSSPAQRKPSRRLFWPWLAGVAGVVLLGALLGLFLAWMSNRSPVVPPPAADLPRPRVLIVLPADGFWAADYQGLMKGLSGHADITIASSRVGLLRPANGEAGTMSKLALADARSDHFDALIFSGGSYLEFQHEEGPRNEATRLTRAMLEAGKPVAGLCSGVAVLAKTGAITDKKVTGFRDIHDLLRATASAVLDEEVVQDGLILTGRDFHAAPQLAAALLTHLRQK